MKKYHHFYLEPKTLNPIRIIAGRTKPHLIFGKVFGVREFNGTEWYMPCFPEITSGKLKTLHYVGKREIKPEQPTPPNGGESE